MSIIERLIYQEEISKRKKSVLTKKREIEELEQCTFHPKVSSY